MSIFTWIQKHQSRPPAQTMSESDAHASFSVHDATGVIGGLSWYRVQFYRAMKLALALSVALAVSLGVIALLLLHRPTPRYFAATPDLRLAPMIPLNQPLLTQQGLPFMDSGYHCGGHVSGLSGMAQEAGSLAEPFR